jgi:UDP-N-acetylmuramoylalanine--D-glutamate ligase
MQSLEGKRVLVAGFARSGRAAADFLARRGAVVTVSDTRPPWSFAAELPDLLSRKIGVEFGQHGSDTFGRQDLVVASPGVPWELPAFEAARERGVPVVAEVETASWFFKGTLVGVTGSNGKTTTTALLGRMLQESGLKTFVGGNIGLPLISMVDESDAESVAVVELSSFQLEGTESMDPQVAVILNITPNHLDRHPNLETYVEAKARILRNQTESDFAVLNADDPVVTGLAERVKGKKIFFSRTQDIPEGLLLSEGHVVYRVGHLQRDLFSPGDVKLRGVFNLENVLAAAAAACVLGADFDAIAKAVREFRGVEHRLEHAGDVLDVAFYNDSKATSVDATVKALGAFDRGIHLILGGKDKGAPYAPLIPLLKNRVREVLLIGAAAERIGRELAGAAEIVPAGDLEAAVRKAFSKARPGDVILLSPACASFDQFQDFEERGRRFKQIVEGLAQEGRVAGLRRTWAQGDSPTRQTPAGSARAPVSSSPVEDAPEPFRLSPPGTRISAVRPSNAQTPVTPGSGSSKPSAPSTRELSTRAPAPEPVQAPAASVRDSAATSESVAQGSSLFDSAAADPVPVPPPTEPATPEFGEPAMPVSKREVSEFTENQKEAEHEAAKDEAPIEASTLKDQLPYEAELPEIKQAPEPAESARWADPVWKPDAALEDNLPGPVETRPSAPPMQHLPAVIEPPGKLGDSTSESAPLGETSVVSNRASGGPEIAPRQPEQAMHERVYIYELEAEERRPIESEESFSIDDLILDRGDTRHQELELQPPAGGREKSARLEEPLIFEVTEAAPTDASSPESVNPPKAASQSGTITVPGEQQKFGKRRRRLKTQAEKSPKE